MTCPHCQNDDPRMLEVAGRIVQCVVCSKTFVLTR